MYSTSRQLFAPVEIESLVTDAPRGTGELEHQNDADPINAVSIYELSKYMANTLLRDTDFMSMAHALEVRVPFVDSVVAPFVLQLPGEWKLDGRRPKPLLLDTLGDLLPQEIWQRPKMGFTLPFERWMLSGLQPELEKVLSRQEGLRRWGLNIQGIQDVWQAFKKSPRRERWSRPWALYVLKKWCQLNEVEG